MSLVLGLEDEINLEEDLDNLEKTILKAMEREKSNQAIIDAFRNKCQEIHNWFDSVLKKMCLGDKGSGLPCPQKLNALKEMSSEFGQAGKDKVDSIKTVGSQVINIVSNLESQQVEEQVSTKYLHTYYACCDVYLKCSFRKFCYTLLLYIIIHTCIISVLDEISRASV